MFLRELHPYTTQAQQQRCYHENKSMTPKWETNAAKPQMQHPANEEEELIIFLWTVNRNKIDIDDMWYKQLHNHNTYIHSNTPLPYSMYMLSYTETLIFSGKYHAD